MRTTSWVVAVLIFALVVAGALIYDRKPLRPDRVIKFKVMPPENTSFTDFDSIVVSPNVLFAFTATDASATRHLWIRELNGVASRRIEGTKGASFPFWSPGSSDIGFFADGKLWRIQTQSGAPRLICDAPSGRGGSWSRYDRIVFAPAINSPLREVSAAGGESAPLTHLDPSHRQLSHRWPSFLPDGKHFVYMVRAEHEASSGTYIAAADSAQGVRLLADPSNATYRHSPEALLFGRGGDLWSQAFDSANLKLVGQPSRVAEGVAATWHIEPLHANFSVSGNGVLAFLSGRATDTLTWFDRRGARLNSVTDPGSHLAPALSSSGELVVDRISSPAGRFDLWRTDLARGTSSPLTLDKLDDVAPVWSPDGSRIAFASNRLGAFNLYEKLSGGAGDERLLLKSARWKFPTDWSSDGQFLLYYEIDPERNRDVFALPLFGEKKPLALLHTDFNESNAVFSPDRKWFAYSSDESGTEEIYVQSFPPPAGSHRWMVSRGGGSHPKWPHDSKDLYYLAPDHQIMAVSLSTRHSFTSGLPRALFQTSMPHDFRIGFAVAKGGNRFLIPTMTSQQNSRAATVVVNWSRASTK
ncbi:MAG: hypothetical protein WKF37_21545 [Bryobacteraceae bacterium]